MATVTPTDRPKSVCNRCVIEVLVAFLCCHVAFLNFSVGVGAFVIGLSQISSLSFSLKNQDTKNHIVHILHFFLHL